MAYSIIKKVYLKKSAQNAPDFSTKPADLNEFIFNHKSIILKLIHKIFEKKYKNKAGFFKCSHETVLKYHYKFIFLAKIL